MIKKELNDQIWYKNFDILFNKDRLNEFFPSKDQSLEEKLNSLVRLSFYISILLLFYKKNTAYLWIFVIACLFTYVIYSNKPDNGNLEPFDINDECTKPTLDNPFMNVTMKDYLNIDESGRIKDRAPACDTSDPEIKKQIDDNFDNNLYKDIDDVFGKMNSQRQFFTMPWTTIPNKQDEFAKWLYMSPQTCKEDQDFCLRYEDVRAKRPVLYNPSENPINN